MLATVQNIAKEGEGLKSCPNLTDQFLSCREWVGAGSPCARCVRELCGGVYVVFDSDQGQSAQESVQQLVSLIQFTEFITPIVERAGTPAS